MDSVANDSHVIFRKKSQKKTIQYVVSSFNPTISPLTQNQLDEIQRLLTSIFKLTTAFDITEHASLIKKLIVRKKRKTSAVSAASNTPLCKEKAVDLKTSRKVLIRTLRKKSDEKSGSNDIWNNVAFGVNKVMKLLEQDLLIAIFLDEQFVSCDTLICTQLQSRLSAVQPTDQFECKLAIVKNLCGLVDHSARRFKRLAALGIKKCAAEVPIFSELCNFVLSLPRVESRSQQQSNSAVVSDAHNSWNSVALSSCIPAAAEAKQSQLPLKKSDENDKGVKFVPLNLLNCSMKSWSQSKQANRNKKLTSLEARRELRQKKKLACKLSRL